LALPLEGVLDVNAEVARLKKEIARCEMEIGKVAGKLSNENFVARAPVEVIEEQRERMASYELEKTQYNNILKTLSEI